jgi:hypothetical protein
VMRASGCLPRVVVSCGRPCAVVVTTFTPGMRLMGQVVTTEVEVLLAWAFAVGPGRFDGYPSPLAEGEGELVTSEARCCWHPESGRGLGAACRGTARSRLGAACRGTDSCVRCAIGVRAPPPGRGVGSSRGALLSRRATPESFTLRNQKSSLILLASPRSHAPRLRVEGRTCRSPGPVNRRQSSPG